MDNVIYTKVKKHYVNLLVAKLSLLLLIKYKNMMRNLTKIKKGNELCKCNMITTHLHCRKQKCLESSAMTVIAP